MGVWVRIPPRLLQKTENREQKTEDREKTVIKSVKDLKVYQMAYQLAINIRERFAKRKYEQVFIRHLNDSFGSFEETRGWLDFAKDCMYITKDEHKRLDNGYDEVNAMLYRLMKNWQNYSDI